MKAIFIGFIKDKPIKIHGDFTVGKVYEVIEKDDKDDTYLVMDNTNFFPKWENQENFILVEDQCNSFCPTHPQSGDKMSRLKRSILFK